MPNSGTRGYVVKKRYIKSIILAKPIRDDSKSPGVRDVPIVTAGITDQISAAVTSRTGAHCSEISTPLVNPQCLAALLKGENIAEQQKNDANLYKLRKYAKQRHGNKHGLYLEE